MFIIKLDKNSLNGSVFFKSDIFSAESMTMILSFSCLCASIKPWKSKSENKSFGILASLCRISYILNPPIHTSMMPTQMHTDGKKVIHLPA